MRLLDETILIIDAIRAINPDARTVVIGDGIGVDINNVTIEWHKGTPISNEDIVAKRDELVAEYNAQEYARKRKAEYPTIEELVVALYDTDDKAAVDEKRAAVKLKYPKS